jgi:hypothetical protein
MFRSNGRQENHISPQVDCRMMRAGSPARNMSIWSRVFARTAVPLQLPADQAMPLCAAHSITISPTDRAADISLPSCTR